VIQKILCDVLLFCTSSVFMWLHMQFLVAAAGVLVWSILTSKLLEDKTEMSKHGGVYII